MSSTAFSNQGPNAAADDYTLFQTLLKAALAQFQTVSIVKVMACTNSGALAPAGTVDVLVLVNLITAAGVAVPHGVIGGVTYQRIQGGANAVIMDPAVGDIGICLFCSRDSSGVRAAKAAANPGSARMFDWADGLYLGGVLNGQPTQYVQFSAAGIAVVSPTKISLQAPAIDIGSASGTTTTIDGVAYLPHTHTNGNDGDPTGGVIT